MDKNATDYRVLDGLRGLAVLYVLFSHASNEGFTIFKGLSFSGNGSGLIGVYLFFVLSAFLLTDQMIKKYTCQNIISNAHIKNYIKKRFLRIYPLFAAALLTLLLTNYLFDDGLFPRFINFNLKSFLKHMMLINGNAHFWTIATEFKFYILLPFITYAALRIKDNIVLLVIFTALLSLISLIIASTWHIKVAAYLPVFLCGCFSAYIYNIYPNGILKLSGMQKLTLNIIIIILAVILMPKVFLDLTGISYKVGNSYVLSIFGVIWASFLLYIMWHNSFITVLLSSKPMCYLGFISYSAYIWHFLILDYLGHVSLYNNIINTILYFLVTIIISHISYFYFEVFFIRRKYHY